MKAKKLLAGLLSAAMVFSSMALPTFAQDGAATTTSATIPNWDANAEATVFAYGTADGEEFKIYATTLQEALEQVSTKTPTGTTTIECKNDANVGAMTHGHVAANLIINGNGAYVSGGERDLALDTAAPLTSDVTVKVDNLDGIAAWGQRSSDATINLEFTDCDNMYQVYFTGGTGTINITLTDCSFNATSPSSSLVPPSRNLASVYSNAAGEITLKNVSFTGVAVPINFKNKSAGTQTIKVENCTFKDCATATIAEETNCTSYAAPIRVVTEGTAVASNVTVTGCSFDEASGEAGNGDILLGDGRNGEISTSNVTLNVSGTAAEIQVQEPNMRETPAVKETVTAADSKTLTMPWVATIDGMKYSLTGALYAAGENDTVVLEDDIDLSGVEWTPIDNFKGTLNGNNKTISGLKISAAHTRTYKNNEGKEVTEGVTGLFANLPNTAVVEDLTINGAEISFADATTQVGVLAGYLYGANVENVTVKNAAVNVTGGQYVGGLCGKLFGTAKDCTVSDSTITGKDQVGGLVGYSWIGYMDGCESISNTVKATEERAGGLIGKMSVTKGDIGGGSPSVTNCTVSGGSATAPDFAGGLIAQFMGNCDKYSITENTVEEITLKAEKTSAFATIRDGQDEVFLNALSTNVSKNAFSDAAIDKLDSDNATAEEKVDTINNAVISKDNAEVTKKVVDTIKNLPVEKKEEIAPAKVEEIIAATDADGVNEKKAETTESEDTAAVTATLKSSDSSLNLTVEPKKTEDSKIELPAGTKAARFEVTVTKTTGTNTENVAETDVPMLLTFKVTNVNNVKSVIRYHGGKQETVPFTRDVENNLIMVTAAKFSEYVVAEATTPTTGGAVLTFEDVTDGDGICSIYLKGDTDAAVTNFESGEFTIKNVVTSGTVGIELEGATGLTINEVDGVYEIHRTQAAANASTYPEVLTGNKILLGTITLNGTGVGQIYAENIKMNKKGNTDSLVVAIPTLSDTLDYDIKAETATLTVKVAFPNAVENQKTTYQDMKITISGGDLAAEDIVYNLGSDASENVAWDSESAVYTLTVADKLTKNVAYTVKVEGAGYRTARYTVNMTGAKTLNFWNNVKDTAVNVEEGVGTAKNTTFLAGDIVKDNQINIYDLSAVVSYFGTDDLVSEHPEYAKYDLNRDGKIDSKDIAYVLVSWNN